MHKKLCFLLLTILSTVSMAQADVLTIPGHVASDHQMMLPRPGSSMDRVLSEFGEPVNRKPAVGDPPITEWDYGDFLVYFEYQTVLHTVNLKTLIMPK